MQKPTFRDPQTAFEDAIRAGRLSRDPRSPIFAGHYMYMGTWGKRDTFKHRLTRRYLPDVPSRAADALVCVGIFLGTLGLVLPALVAL